MHCEAVHFAVTHRALDKSIGGTNNTVTFTMSIFGPSLAGGLTIVARDGENIKRGKSLKESEPDYRSEQAFSPAQALASWTAIQGLLRISSGDWQNFRRILGPRDNTLIEGPVRSLRDRMDLEDRVRRDRLLRNAVLGGDERAWQMWVDETFDDLYGYIRWRCSGLRDDVDDALRNRFRHRKTTLHRQSLNGDFVAEAEQTETATSPAPGPNEGAEK